jgi:hypothetical protein
MSEPIDVTHSPEEREEIRARQADGSRRWKVVGPSWKVARCCYDDLGRTWTDHAEWTLPALTGS